MKKISLFILLILTYLGLSKSFSPSEKKSKYITNKHMLSNLFPNEFTSIILLDSFEAGLLIKTYFQKLKIFSAFNGEDVITIRSSSSFQEENKLNIGLSIFRRLDYLTPESYTPMPPGALFVGNRSFGRWKTLNSGRKRWVFRRAYKHFPQSFHWGNFRPSYQFYEKIKSYHKNNKTFRGVQNEFGTNGLLTKKTLTSKRKRSRSLQISILNHLEYLTYIPPWDQDNK